MIRALYTAASGMKAQQTNLDITSNNLANVNTTGFKKDFAQVLLLRVAHRSAWDPTWWGHPVIFLREIFN